MVYGVLRMINFAHGEVYMAGAYVAFLAVEGDWFGVRTQPAWWNVTLMVLCAMVFCMLLGVLIERLAYKPVRKASRLIALITAIGVSYLLQNVALLIFGASPKYAIVELSAPAAQEAAVTGFRISTGQAILLVTTIIFMVLLRIIVQYTRFGRGMRAVSQDMQAASLMGVPSDRVIMGTFALGAALAGAGGAMTAAFVGNQIFPLFGFMPGVKAFVSAVLGGIGNIPGAVLGGLLLGVIEALVGGNPTLTGYRDAVAFFVLIAVLLFRPAGLLGKSVQEKV